MAAKDSRCDFINHGALKSIDLAQGDEISSWFSVHKGHINIGFVSDPSILLYDKEGLSREGPLEFYQLEKCMQSIEGVDRVSGSIQQGYMLLSIKDGASAYEVIKPALQTLLEQGCIAQSELPRIYKDLDITQTMKHAAQIKTPTVSQNSK